MNDIEQITAKYRDGDLKTQINIFMEHRSLRNSFAEIDKKENLNTDENDLILSPLINTIKAISFVFHNCQRILGRFKTMVSQHPTNRAG